MPTQPCPNPPSGSQIIAQTLFLGASVNSFNVNMGWGSQPSQLTVTLVEDTANTGCLILNGERKFIAEQLPKTDTTSLVAASDNNDILNSNGNHYHDCSGDSCYVTPQGAPFNSSTMDISQRMVPGKVYYGFVNSDPQNKPCFQSSYWYNPDPGFFGKPNRIAPDNTYNAEWTSDNSNLNKGYDIIDTPVLFKMGNFTFGGLVQGWTEQLGQGGRIYNVTINGMQSLLNSCYIIVGSYAGAVYSKSAGSIAGPLGAANNSIYGGPRNYTLKTGVDYFGAIYEGNMPNVFNVYGFLESFGVDGFGGSQSTTDGISANKIIDALSVLTSSTGAGTKLSYASSGSGFSDYGPRLAYSPFGRILSKCMQENDTYTPIANSFSRFGVIPPNSLVQAGSTTNRCSFMLDLSELPRFPNDYRITGPVITITQFLETLSDAGGFDFCVELLPIWNTQDTKLEHVIKIKTIPRLSQPRPYEIQNTVNAFKCNQYAISSVTIGKEKNDSAARSMIIGGPIQRLYQAKSYRLAYTQSNFIYDPYRQIFIDYMQLGNLSKEFINSRAATKQFHHGKTKFPVAFDLHNINLSNIINPSYSGLYNHNNEIKAQIPSINFKFDDIDSDWVDNAQLGNNIFGKVTGNYGKAVINKIQFDNNDLSTWGTTDINQRFFPLFKDVICPFFGFVMDNTLDIATDNSNNDFRRIRPVWFDTWTGQIVVLIRVSELPATSVNLKGLMTISGIEYFMLTESEIRAALVGFDEFLVYCLSKTFKNELLEMLRRAYILKFINKYKAEGMTDQDARNLANRRHDWFWQLMGSNIAGPFQLTVGQTQHRFAGTHKIDRSALKDLDALWEFVKTLGSYYGKKYMVVAPYLAGYRDDKFANIILPTQAGNAYVFNGGGGLHYNYEPTNDGAWEEYGNIIDDSIAVGGKEWYTITDDVGKIKPLLGYNANDGFDITAYNICLLNNNKLSTLGNHKLNPMWNFELWEHLKDKRDATCDTFNFTYPILNYSNLESTSYALINVSGFNGTLPSIYNQFQQQTPVILPPQLSGFTSAKNLDAFGTEVSITGMKKLYITTTTDNGFAFLDPSGLREPRILVNSPGLFLNNSSNLYSQDPNNTILANVAMEDLLIYMRMTRNPQNRNISWINYMLSYVYSVLNDDSFLTSAAGGASSNKSASYALLHPKAAHPFFAGIPLKSNIHNYGPWINNPYINYLENSQDVFPSGNKITINDALPPVCSTGLVTVDPSAAQRAVDNWILPTIVKQEPDYVPWNYGGMAFLDSVAISEARKNTNYQNVLELAQIDMPGLPLFNLGSSFTYNQFSSLPLTSNVVFSGYQYTDKKYDNNSPLTQLNNFNLPGIFTPFLPTLKTEDLTYDVLGVSGHNIIGSGSPVITNIQVNNSQAGISTTYSFRTYTKKIGLFNRENSENIKQAYLNNIRRNKQLAKIDKQIENNAYAESRKLITQQVQGISSKDFRSKLYGWSPVKVLIGQASPYIPPLKSSSDIVFSGIRYGGVGSGNSSGIQTNNDTNKPSFVVQYGSDLGDDKKTWGADYLTEKLSLPALASTMRYRTDVGLFEEKEVNAQIDQDYGLQSMMSLDGLFSPVSFFPTFKNSTFHFGLYKTSSCPFCSGTKTITTRYLKYLSTSDKELSENEIGLYCDKCSDDSLQSILKSNTTSASTSQSTETLPPYIITSGTDIKILSKFNNKQISTPSSSNSSASMGSAGINIPINMVSLQPIVVPYGEFKNPNVQNYSGVHPDGSGVHENLSIGVFSDNAPRTFFDRCRHSIEVVGRGSVVPQYINISDGLKQYIQTPEPDPEDSTKKKIINADYYDKDYRLSDILNKRQPGMLNRPYQNNHRFMGLRGPLVMHAWGYDLDGYPVPNAADEPYEIDEYNRPRRFKIKYKDGYPKNNIEYKTLNKGDIYTPNTELGGREYVFGTDDKPSGIKPTDLVSVSAYEDNMKDRGGFGPPPNALNGRDRLAGFQGSIIGKTQKWIPDNPGNLEGAGKWTEKKKLKEFYLNWAERPDIWPVGPIDLRWDNDRKVWATKSDVSIYRMVYVTLEEDLVKDDDVDETYPARGFLDDLEYSTQPLDKGLRRLVFVKDRAGYTAPRGAKLLCRYDTSTGFYEPVSKQIFVAKGIITPGSNSATIEMSYAPGKKRGEAYPTMIVNFENLFDLPTTDNKGLFTFMNSRWVLTTSK